MPLQSVSEKTKGDTGRSLFELALLHTLVLKKKKKKKSLEQKEGEGRAMGRVTHPRQKARDQPCLSPGDTAKHQDRPWNLPNNTRGKGPGFPRWFTVKHRANTPANNGPTKNDTGTGKSANQRWRESAWNDLWKANRSPSSANTALWNIPRQWQPPLLISKQPFWIRGVCIGTESELDWKQIRVDYLT